MYLVEALEAGVVTRDADAAVHAVRITLHGPETLCGAGPVVAGVLGRFGEASELACLACFAVALDEPRGAVMPTPRPRGQ
jgi:hypothetical protein